MAKADISSITSRRTLLGAIAAAPTAVTTPAASAHQDPHPAWLAEERRLDKAAALALHEDDEERGNAPVEQLLETQERIIRTPAVTLAGMAAVVRYIAGIRDAGVEVIDDDCRALLGVAECLDLLVGRA